MVAFGAMAFMMVAGWQFNLSGTEEVFSDKEVALENDFAGSCCYKVTWASCPGSFQQVISCRPEGSGCCSSSWQEHCG
jgi:hypothetical protein